LRECLDMRFQKIRSFSGFVFVIFHRSH
jgi:hypothetical protein